MAESSSERADRYRKMASDVRREAWCCGDCNVATAYLEVARGWLKLAEDQRPAPERSWLPRDED